ncbi:probable pectinesterase 53 [Impatiens glandulifera]|uniref:probable pectinesterase 53 n=1 Tax=Impatiens glandulifera TaxID=253017 RepID=UPI001FB17C18|nr:probable pectinesterase 53 [Impatiens glandulifera]
MVLKLILLLLAFLLQRTSFSWPISNGSSGNKENSLAMANIREAHTKWLKIMGSFNHSLSQQTNNKLKPCKIIRVNQMDVSKKKKNKKKKQFNSVQKAIDSIPILNNCRVIICVAQGIYKEKVEIPTTMAYVTLQGEGVDKTIIEWDDTADRMGRHGHPLGTYGSSTFAVNSAFFIAKDITFKNKAPSPPSGALGKQAVALRVSGDMAAFLGCKFIGGQDTLYDHVGRHYFKNCYIEGSVDFIFGNGLSMYEGCHLHANANTFGSLTAQKRESYLEETGFSFVGCKVTGSGALYLGRAWGSFSTVVFAYTYMDKIIVPRGWYNWGDKNRELTVFYGQFKCSGPGANYGGRVSWSRELTQQEASPFVSLDFIDGSNWLKGLI